MTSSEKHTGGSENPRYRWVPATLWTPIAPPPEPDPSDWRIGPSLAPSEERETDWRLGPGGLRPPHELRPRLPFP
jgi:hypothetical protein